MRSEVEEITPTCYVGDYTPGRIIPVEVILDRMIQFDINKTHPAYSTAINKLLYLQEIGQHPAIIGNKQRHRGLFAGPEHLLAFSVVACHRLFDVHCLACLCSLDSIFGVRVGWSGNINGINVGVVYKSLSIVIEFCYVVAASVIFSFAPIAAHNGNKVRVFDFLKGRSTFDLGDGSASYHSPAYLFHKQPRKTNLLMKSTLKAGDNVSQVVQSAFEIFYSFCHFVKAPLD